ncbi:MAG: prepilin-type N-terminal cleavage/methylation domain-containing protein [Phycisphaerales bacterium]
MQSADAPGYNWGVMVLAGTWLAGACPLELRAEQPARTRGVVRPRRLRRAGFTLVETIVTIAIIALLLTLLLPALGAAQGSARRHACLMNLRRIATDFALFADANAGTPRGDDDRNLPRGQFYLSTFIESEFGISEFWNGSGGGAGGGSGGGAGSWAPLPQDHILRCPEVKGQVLLSNGPCTGGPGGGISPPSRVSYGFNLRLHKRPPAPGKPSIGFLRLRESILSNPGVPLVWDTDAAAANAKGVSDTSFSAPSLGAGGAYASDRYWNPSLRHGGRNNIVLMDGSARATDDPLSLPGVRWDFVPR